jgi:hypothetical protein
MPPVPSLFWRPVAIVEPVSVIDNRVSGRIQDAKTEIEKSRTETPRRNSRFSSRKWELVGARDRVGTSQRTECREFFDKPANVPKSQNCVAGLKGFEPVNGEFGLRKPPSS